MSSRKKLWIIKRLVGLLPDRMKRLLVIVSLYGHLLEKKNVDAPLKLDELNVALKLAKTDRKSVV